MLPSHASVASRPSQPRHRLTRLISRPAPKPHLSPTSSCTRHPQLARARSQLSARPRSPLPVGPDHPPVPAPARPRSPRSLPVPAPRPSPLPGLPAARPQLPARPPLPGIPARPRPRRTRWNAVKPRIQWRVLTPWIRHQPRSDAAFTEGSGTPCGTKVFGIMKNPQLRGAIPGFAASGTRPPLQAPDPMERDETRDPVRSNALDPGFHCAASGAPRPAAGRPGTYSATSTRLPPRTPNPEPRTPNPERKPSATPNSRQTFSRSQ
jgi:hypothetical protein